MKNRIKEDNHGFTLVEIVVTIMVLAIITVPLLSYFTDSVRHSARTKQQQNAVVLAQNTLEELKVSGQNLSDPHEVLATPDPAVSPQPTWIPWKELAAQPLPTPTGSFYPSYYLYRNVSENDRSYLVQIKVTPKHDLERTDPADSTKTLTEVYEGITLPEVNSSTDVILQEDSTPFNEAVRQFHTRQGGTVSRDDIAQDVKRSIRVTFQEDSAASANVNVVIYYNYHYTGSVTGLSGSDTYYQVPVKSSSLPAKDLRNIFIFFEPDAKGDHLQFGPEDPDDPNLEHSLDFATLSSASKGMKEGQVKLYLIAQNSAPAGKGDGTVAERPATYKFTTGAVTANDVYKIFANKAPADSDKTVFTNLLKSEVNSSGSDLQYLFSEKRDDSGGTEYTLIKKEETDRIAEVEVSVYRDMGAGEATLADEKKRLTTVNGAVVLDK
ncbi:MAG: type II secretion system GspH family protein [Ruminococcus flavefaciens]|nr:type II secretion system GspH family protein [Ruminococcus flavefaciens]